MARESSDGGKIYLVVEKVNPGTPETPDEPETPETLKTENKKVTPTMTIKDIAGGTLTGTIFGTGAVVTTAEYKYTIIMLGDVNGDGNVTPADYVKVKNHIMGTSVLSNVNKSAADVNGDGQITPADYVKIKNHIMSVSQISL